MRAIHAGASKVRESVLQPSPAEVCRHPALWLVGQSVTTPQRPFSVLLVDDNPHHRTPLLRALRDQGHSVLHAAEGASGETLCRTSQLEIDALVARADMKRTSGFELARRVVRMLPEVRVLLMGHRFAGPEEAHRAYERGYAVIEEPFTPQELCRRLARLLGSPRYDACAGPPLHRGDRLFPREDEASPSVPGLSPQKEIRPWNRAKAASSPKAVWRSGSGRFRS